MNRVECKTQKQVDAALKNGDVPILIGDGRFVLTGTSFVIASENSHAELWGNSHAVLWGNSHAELWGNSHAVLRGNSHAVLWGNSHAVLSKYAAAHILSKTATANGGVVIPVEAPKTPVNWCDFYGAKHDGEVAVLFKAVAQDYCSPHGTCYAPGTMPEASDWDGGKEECGGGLHFCAHPVMALGYNEGAKKFVACPVRLEDIAVHPEPSYPNKIKAKRVCAPIWECDRWGKPLVQESQNKGAMNVSQ